MAYNTVFFPWEIELHLVNEVKITFTCYHYHQRIKDTIRTTKPVLEWVLLTINLKSSNIVAFEHKYSISKEREVKWAVEPAGKDPHHLLTHICKQNILFFLYEEYYCYAMIFLIVDLRFIQIRFFTVFLYMDNTICIRNNKYN